MEIINYQRLVIKKAVEKYGALVNLKLVFTLCKSKLIGSTIMRTFSYLVLMDMEELISIKSRRYLISYEQSF